MRSRLTLWLLFIGLNSFALEKASLDLAGLNEMQRFYYQQGAESARVIAYQDGYRKATENFKELVSLYASKIKAYESAKYLLKQGKITYPSVYRINDGTGYKVHFEPPAVEKEFTENDLFILPLLTAKEKPKDENIKKSAIDDDATLSGFEDNAFSVPERDDVLLNRDSAPEVRKEKTVVHIPHKNEGLVQAINSYNIEYSSTQDGYDLFFANPVERDDFCVKVTGNTKCAIN